MGMTWTEADDERLIGFIKMGLSAGETGREMSITRSAVIGRIYRLKHKLGPNLDLAGTAFSGPAPILRRAPSLTAEQREAIHRLHAAGHSYATIAIHMKLDRRQVGLAAKELGLTPNRAREQEDASLRERLSRAMDRLPRQDHAPLEARFREGFQGQTGRISITGLREGVCHFPIDQEMGPVRYCGAEARPNGKWCAHHWARVTIGAPNGR